MLKLITTIDGVRIYLSTLDDHEYLVVHEDDSPRYDGYFTDCLKDAIKEAQQIASA